MSHGCFLERVPRLFLSDQHWPHAGGACFDLVPAPQDNPAGVILALVSSSPSAQPPPAAAGSPRPCISESSVLVWVLLGALPLWPQVK